MNETRFHSFSPETEEQSKKWTEMAESYSIKTKATLATASDKLVKLK